MEYSPPPLFKQGAPARVKVTVFALISVALLMIDSHMHSLATVRQVAATALYPLQMVALMPRDAIHSVGDYFSSLTVLQNEVRDLKRQQVADARVLQQAQLYQAENAQLRKLMEARSQLPVRSMMGEILYDARDPATRKIVLDRGSQQGVSIALPVIDNQGVVGQVTRVFPFTSEVTLLTDKDQAIPVQVLRNGLRSVAYGRGSSGMLDLRFMAPNADIQVGDILITSGIDGVYPAGLAVAKVAQVENNGAGAFGRVVCQPLAGIDRNRQLLILMALADQPPRPLDDEPRPDARADGKPGGKKHVLPKMAPIHEAADAAAAGKPAATPTAAATVKAPATTPAAIPAAAPAVASPAGAPAAKPKDAAR